MENNKLTAPLAIIIAGVIIAGAVLYSGRGVSPTPTPSPVEAEIQFEKLNPLSPTDHLRGNPNAPVVILEYSDLECPFCKVFHQTMLQVMQAYGDQVAWVYRHLPLDRHPKAQTEAEATECVAELGGEDKFWQYLDAIFAITPSNNGLDLAQLPILAESLGIESAALENCLASGRHAARVDADASNAVAAGGTYTPFSIMITGTGPVELGGAIPFEQIRALIDEALE